MLWVCVVTERTAVFCDVCEKIIYHATGFTDEIKVDTLGVLQREHDRLMHTLKFSGMNL